MVTIILYDRKVSHYKYNYVNMNVIKKKVEKHK